MRIIKVYVAPLNPIEIHFLEAASNAWQIMSIIRTMKKTKKIYPQLLSLSGTLLEFRRIIRFNVETNTFRDGWELQKLAFLIDRKVKNILRKRDHPSTKLNLISILSNRIIDYFN